MTVERVAAPWRVSPEQFRELAAKVKPTPELMETKKRLDAKRGYATGHLEAWLYLRWKSKHTPKQIAAYWKKYEAA